MKICYISHQMNDKGSGGAQVSLANFELLRKSQGKDNVESICLSDFKCTNKITRKIVIFLRSILGLSSCMGYFATKSFLNSDLLKKSDLIWCDCSLYGSLIKKIKKRYPKKRVITFFHNIEVDFYKSIYPKDKYIYELFIQSARKNEEYSAIYSTNLVALTEQDRSRIEELYGKKVKYLLPVLFNNLAITNLEPTSLSNSGYKALFVGSDFPPNIEAIKFLCREVMPYVKDSISLTIVGKGMDKYKEDFETKNIKVYGFVENLSYIYEESNIVLSPIFSGAGMKVKIAEAFKHGKGVLGTEFSFQGYDLEKDFIVIANEAIDYINYLNNFENRIIFNCREIESYFNNNFTITSKIKSINKIIS